jgi:hypothetical protein
MGWFDKITGKNTEQQATPSASQAPRPLGLHLGASVVIDPMAFTLLGTDLLALCPKDTQFVEAVGTLDLGEGNLMYRFYLSDDSFIQVNTENGQVVDSKIFNYLEGIDPRDRAHFDSLLTAGSRIGMPTLKIQTQLYDRVWGNDDPQSWAPPLELNESVVKKDSHYDLTIYPMLYQRAIPGKADQYEYALITGEDSGPDDYCVSIAVGVDISSADLQVL